MIDAKAAWQMAEAERARVDAVEDSYVAEYLHKDIEPAILDAAKSGRSLVVCNWRGYTASKRRKIQKELERLGYDTDATCCEIIIRWGNRKIKTLRSEKMTIKELYEWAEKNGVENLPVYYNENGACNLVCDVFVEDAQGKKIVVMY